MDTKSTIGRGENFQHSTNNIQLHTHNPNLILTLNKKWVVSRGSDTLVALVVRLVLQSDRIVASTFKQSTPLLCVSIYMNRLGEFRLEVVLGDEADDVFSDLTVLEYKDGGDCADFVFTGNFAVVVDVDFANFNAVTEFGGEFIEDGCNGFAGPTPRCPEINDHGNSGVANGRIKVGAIEFGYIFGHMFSW